MMRLVTKLSVLALSVSFFSGVARAQNGIDWPRYQDMAVELMQQYLRVNTSNPPGNEIEAARFFKKIFDEHGIENEIFEYTGHEPHDMRPIIVFQNQTAVGFIE